jgi:hypothetical protein
MPVSIYGIQAAQAAMLRAANAARPGSGLDAAVKEAGAAAHRYAVAITHVDTGGLRAAHRLVVGRGRAEIFIDPAARRSDGRRPAQYGTFEHARGGSHAFYGRVVDERLQEVGEAAARGVRRWLSG